DLGQRKARREKRSIEVGRRAPRPRGVARKTQLPQHFAKMKMRDRRCHILARRATKARNRVGGTTLVLMRAPALQPRVECFLRHYRSRARNRATTPARARR